MVRKSAFNLKDALLRFAKALPAAAASIYTDALDTKNSVAGQFVAECELIVTAPALTTSQLGDTKTMTYTIETDDDVAFGSPSALITGLIVQTGAGGAGSAGSTVRVALPSNCERYVRLKVTNSYAQDASGATAVLEVAF